MNKQRRLEEQQLADDLASGIISPKEYDIIASEIDRAERDEQRERAEAAYDREMDRP